MMTLGKNHSSGMDNTPASNLYWRVDGADRSCYGCDACQLSVYGEADCGRV